MLNELKSLDSEPFNDITLAIRGTNVKIVDMSYLNDNIGTIRNFFSFILWFLLALYHYNQVYYLIRGTYPIKDSDGIRRW